ncbi:MAG: helix-turn-helix domain-containing protein [Armatimonadota bacterium]
MQTIFDIDTAQLHGVGMTERDAGWHMSTHSHTHWEFVYFLRGCGSVNLPYATLRPRYYHLLIFYPRLPHAETADPLDPEETIYLSVNVTGTPPPGMPILLADPHGELRWLCEHIYQEMVTYHTITPLANTYTRAFLQLIERAWQSTPSPAIDPVKLAMQYLVTNYASQVTLETLASIANVTPMHLTHCFTAQVGTSPIQYLKVLRIEAAKQLLATTALLVNDIAQRVGYADPLYFRRVFKSVTGQTPSACRQHGVRNL